MKHSITINFKDSVIAGELIDNSTTVGHGAVIGEHSTIGNNFIQFAPLAKELEHFLKTEKVNTLPKEDIEILREVLDAAKKGNATDLKHALKKLRNYSLELIKNLGLTVLANWISKNL